MNALFRNSNIRLVNFGDPDDEKLIREIMTAAYGARVSEGGVPWINLAIKSPNAIVLLGRDVFGIASIVLKYGFERRPILEILAARKSTAATFEAFNMIKAMARWAALQGAQYPLRLDSDTGIDFGPFAQRLGGVQVDPVKYPRYDIPLDGGDL